MNTAQINEPIANQIPEPISQKPLRLWPGVVVVALQWLACLIPFVFAPDAVMYGMLGGVLGGLVILVWWLFFSRAPWVERIGAIALIIVALLGTKRVVHESLATAGMGFLLFIFAIPVLSLALVFWAAATRHLSNGLRRAALVAIILLACGMFTLVRTGGISGGGKSDFHWRWTQTPEERLLAQAGNEPTALTAAPAASVAGASEKPLPSGSAEPLTPTSSPTAEKTAEKPPVPAAAEARASWPGFRGPNRDGVIRGVQIETNWSKSPPVELWRQKIGPGWSSFAVRGELVYTQEQRGETEVVSCYNLTSGKLVWRHSDAARFWESNAGAGPRGTPTLSHDRVYSFGGTGILNALNARDGSVIWSRNAASDTGAKLPMWGFASSPLIVNDLVIIAASGRLAAYDVATGQPRWLGPDGGSGYSSPHLLTIDGVTQILLLDGNGATSVAPTDGTLLWEHQWKSDGIVQPAVIAGGDVLIGSGSGGVEVGLRRLAIARGPGGWKAEERWTSNALKPYFNDFVVHHGYAFGFDGSILACLDLKDGKRKWKGGRYGHGQLVLLPDQDLILVLSEEGELALVKATPDQFTEVARIPAIEGKTWNHPALVGDVLLVRNSEEMAAFRLSLAGR